MDAERVSLIRERIRVAEERGNDYIDIMSLSVDEAKEILGNVERYQARQTELLASNNALLERARNAEMALQALTKLTEKAALASAG